MPKKTAVTVKIIKENGWYIATSQDLDGLIVCHQSLMKFAQELPACIKALYKANYNMEVDVEEVPSLDNHDVSQLVFEAILRTR